jgi:subtilisin family serine protease
MRVGAVLCVLATALVLAPASLAANDPLRTHQWGLDMIHADQAHQVSDGAGATVAVVDTGVMVNHPDLAGRLLPGDDVLAGGPVTRDGNGHGTHVSGIIAADEGNGIGIDGVAPLAKILPVRVLGDDGSGSDADVATGVNWATDHGAQVINLSLGSSPISNIGQSAFSDAVNRALDHGVVVVMAAGNDTLPICEQPDTAGRALCVGSVDKRGNQSFFSSFGMGVNVFAPGGSGLPGTDEDILSTYNDGGYQFLAGTSQATPHVSAVAALLESLGLRGQAVVQRILATLSPGSIVNAAAAVQGLGPAPAGTPGASTPTTTSSSTHQTTTTRRKARHKRRRHHRAKKKPRRTRRPVAHHR